jgi:hypothetical protein
VAVNTVAADTLLAGLVPFEELPGWSTGASLRGHLNMSDTSSATKCHASGINNTNNQKFSNRTPENGYRG